MADSTGIEPVKHMPDPLAGGFLDQPDTIQNTKYGAWYWSRTSLKGFADPYLNRSVNHAKSRAHGEVTPTLRILTGSALKW